MADENRSFFNVNPVMRVTRARAKALGIVKELPPLYPSKQDENQGLRRDSKREAGSLAASSRQKKRVVLKDVTNVKCDKLQVNGRITAKGLPTRQDEKVLEKKGKLVCFQFSKTYDDLVSRRKNETGESKDTEEELQETTNSTSQSQSINLKISAPPIFPAKIVSKDGYLLMKLETLEGRGITNIDKKNNDLQMCSLYAADIYHNMYAKEVDQRPLHDYMEKLQKDITKGMRAILIDWLVEVSEEYRLVPDTLYLTVNLIDRYLSKNYIEKQKLQLLGVTCMLIASKYEEICAPRVEEDFCFITDNTYSKEEVLKMESRVLNLLRFKLSIPTTKKFLRRFIQAAQVAYEVPSAEFEFLANYLAELTLVDYNFLKYLPSLVAASAVFLARWTLDPSGHPWNLTLEHYTRYKAKELEFAVLDLQNLQLNTRNCTLNAIRGKYKQAKFKAVSTLISSQRIESLFQSLTDC